MRYLHRVAESERFIAKGVYRSYSYEGDILLSKRESWTRHQLAGGGILTRIDREGEAKGLTTLAEVLTDETGQVERLTIREWNTDPNATYRTLRANYFYSPNEIQATRTYDDQPMDEAVILLPPQGYLHPPFYVFMSLAMVKSVLAFTPIWNQSTEDRLGFVRSEYLDEPIKEDEGSVFTYHFPDSTFIFDQHMILQEYLPKSESSPFNRIVLTEYAHI